MQALRGKRQAAVRLAVPGQQQQQQQQQQQSAVVLPPPEHQQQQAAAAKELPGGLSLASLVMQVC
jgi:hypothetical protein